MNSMISFHNIPPLAGAFTFEDSQRPGFSVEECVKRLKCYHYILKRSHLVLNNRIPSEPIYELKMAFSLHSHYCAEHVSAIRKRVGEMREPPLGLENIPDENLEILFDEIIAAPSTEELLIGLYEVAFPFLKSSLQEHLEITNPLADHPSVRIIRFALLEIEEMILFGKSCLEEIDKKLPVSMLTFSGVVWPPNNAKPLQPKWAAKWAGPVSFEITYFAPISNFAN